MTPEPLEVDTERPLEVDTERLAAAARRLLAAANEIPKLSAPPAVTGSDPLSQAIAAQAAKVEAQIAERLAAVQKEATRQAENVATAARTYEESDREIAARTNKQTFPSDDPAQRHGAQAVGYGTKPESPATGPLPRPGDMSSGDLDKIDKANRDLLNRMANEYSHLPDGQVKTDRLADIAGIRKALETPDSHLIFLAKPDDPSQMIRAATAIGNPFTADHVSVTVPGVSSTTRQSLATMTQEARGLRKEAQLIALAKHLPDTTSTIAWMGYQPPLTLTSPDTLTDGLARAGAPKLESFLSDLNAGSHNPRHTTALFGHSYGSLLSGIALKDGASSMVDNVVLYGSPVSRRVRPRSWE